MANVHAEPVRPWVTKLHESIRTCTVISFWSLFVLLAPFFFAAFCLLIHLVTRSRYLPPAHIGFGTVRQAGCVIAVSCAAAYALGFLLYDGKVQRLTRSYSDYSRPAWKPFWAILTLVLVVPAYRIQPWISLPVFLAGMVLAVVWAIDFDDGRPSALAREANDADAASRRKAQRDSADRFVRGYWDHLLELRGQGLDHVPATDAERYGQYRAWATNHRLAICPESEFPGRDLEAGTGLAAFLWQSGEGPGPSPREAFWAAGYEEHVAWCRERDVMPESARTFADAIARLRKSAMAALKERLRTVFVPQHPKHFLPFDGGGYAECLAALGSSEGARALPEHYRECVEEMLDAGMAAYLKEVDPWVADADPGGCHAQDYLRWCQSHRHPAYPADRFAARIRAAVLALGRDVGYSAAELAALLSSRRESADDRQWPLRFQVVSRGFKQTARLIVAKRDRPRGPWTVITRGWVEGGEEGFRFAVETMLLMGRDSVEMATVNEEKKALLMTRAQSQAEWKRIEDAAREGVEAARKESSGPS